MVVELEQKKTEQTSVTKEKKANLTAHTFIGIRTIRQRAECLSCAKAHSVGIYLFMS